MISVFRQIRRLIAGRTLLLGLVAAGVGLLTFQAARTARPPDRSAEPAPEDGKHAGQAGHDLAGDPLPPGAVARLGTLRLCHLGYVSDVCFCADGTILASAGADNRIRLWDPATGRELRCLAGHLGSVRHLASAPSGKLLASAGDDGTVRLWDATTGKEVGSPIRSSASFLAFAPDGKTLAFGGRDPSARPPDYTIRLWDVAAGKEVRSLSLGQYAMVYDAAAFAPDGKTLAVVKWYTVESEIHAWDLATGRELPQWAGQHKPAPAGPFTKGKPWPTTNLRKVASVAFAPDGKALASAEMVTDAEGKTRTEINLWDPATGKKRWSVPASQEYLSTVRFSPDGRFLASSGGGSTVLWELTGGKPPRPVWEGEGAGRLAFGPRGRLLAWAAGQAVRILDTATRQRTPPQAENPDAASFMAFADGRTVVSTRGAIRVWDAATGRLRRTIPARTNWFRPAAAVSPDGKYLVAGIADRATRWDLSAGKAVGSFGVPNDQVRAVAISPDGKVLATYVETLTSFRNADRQSGQRHSAKDEFVRLWDLATGKELGRFGQSLELRFLAFAAGGTRLVGVSREVIHVWDLPSGKPLLERRIRPRQRITKWPVGLSADGKWLFTCDPENLVEAWDVATEKPARLLRGHRAPVRTAAASPDGKALATAGEGGTVRVWDAATGQLRHEIRGHQAEIVALAFAPDGRRLASASADTTILVWDLAGLPKGANLPVAPITPLEFRGLWADLGTSSRAGLPSAADRSMRRLVSAPASALPLLQKQLAGGPVNRRRVKELINDLGSDSYQARQKAHRELEKLGPAAVPALQNALAGNPAPEVRRRLEELLNKQRAGGKAPTRELTLEEWQLVRAAVVLGRIDRDSDTGKARELLAALAADPRLQDALAAGWEGDRLIKEAKAALGWLSR
jgi:WD40 repeat protein